MPNVGLGEWMVILLVALLIVGPQKLPELSRRLGKAVREFRRVSGKAQQELRTAVALDEFTSALYGSSASAPAPPKPSADSPPPVDPGPPAMPRAVPVDAPVAPAVDLGPPGWPNGRDPKETAPPAP